MKTCFVYFNVAVTILIITMIGGCSKEDHPSSVKKSVKKAVPLYSNLMRSVRHDDAITTISFQPDGKVVVSGADAGDTEIRFHDIHTGDLLKSIKTPQNRHIAFSPDGKTLVGGDQNTVKFWNAETGAELRTIKHVATSLRALAVSPDGRFLVSGGLDDRIRFWDFKTGKFVKDIKIEGFCWFIVFSEDGRYLATGGNPDVQLIESAKGKIVAKLKGYIFDPMNTANNDTFSAAFTPNGKFLITGGADGIVRFWEMPSGNIAKQFEKQGAAINDIAITPDGETFVVAGFTDIRLYYVNSGRLIKVLSDVKRTNRLAISPDGKSFASGGFDRVLRLWKIS